VCFRNVPNISPEERKREGEKERKREREKERKKK